MVGGQIRPLSPAPSTTSGGASAGPNLSANVLLATADLVAGELTSLEVDYPNATGLTLNGLQLSWSSVSTPKSVIPRRQLYADSSFTFDGPLTTFKLLTRIALLVNTFRITLDDLIYLSANAAAFREWILTIQPGPLLLISTRFPPARPPISGRFQPMGEAARLLHFSRRPAYRRFRAAYALRSCRS